jgi:hypothetical protein
MEREHKTNGKKCWCKTTTIYPLVSFEVRVTKGEGAELVALDSKGNEYRFEKSVYVLGENHKVEENIICTEL